jgi:putative FmdB family regulatory protein
MPIYEYGCAACGVAFSRLRPIAAAAEPAACPACGAAAERSLSRFAIGGHAAPPAETPSTAPLASGPELCQRYPHIPLLCHMEPKAAARWIAKAEGREEQYLEREARRERQRQTAGLPPEPSPAHDGHHFGHHAGHVHAAPAPPASEG